MYVNRCHCLVPPPEVVRIDAIAWRWPTSDIWYVKGEPVAMFAMCTKYDSHKNIHFVLSPVSYCLPGWPKLITFLAVHGLVLYGPPHHLHDIHQHSPKRFPWYEGLAELHWDFGRVDSVAVNA